ncbi:hemerythrin domain-containing protein [Streptomyces coeruleorubidus]|uniref:hemerythrin domain-containing protein n=1 Tax=Streptomyces coeruleorubidus TaxID=116188 RepID=UPI0036592721
MEKTTGDERRAAFRRLVRLLAVHETAEEEVIHPFTRRAGPGGKVVEERLREGREARELLSCLDGMDTDGPKFLPEPQVRLDVMRHARAEERHRVPVGLLYRAQARDSPCSSRRGPLPGRWAERAADSPDGPESASQRRLAAFGRDSETEAGRRRALGAHSDGPTAGVVVDDHRSPGARRRRTRVNNGRRCSTAAAPSTAPLHRRRL